MDSYHQNVEIPERQVIDHKRNTHGKQFIDLLSSRSMGLCTLNGRGKDSFTYMSPTGSSVVDYYAFSVTTMREII